MSSILKVDQLQDSGGNAIITSDGAGNLTAGTIPAKTIGTGAVLQVVHGSTTTTVTNNTGTFATTGLSASITPTSSSNKIAIMATINGLLTTGTTTSAKLELRRDSTSLVIPQYFAGYDTASTDNQRNIPVFELDSPSTTSAITYEIFFLRASGSSNCRVQANNSESTIILMEIAG
jgi:hypothetical protein